MSTPSNKRDARREARKANLANAQAARRAGVPKPTDTDAAVNAGAPAERAAEMPEIVASDFVVPVEPVELAPEMTAQPVVEKPATAKTTPTTPPAGTAKPAARPSGAQAGASKPITRPTGGGATANKTSGGAGTAKTPTTPVAGTTKTPTRPNTGAAANARPSGGAGATRTPTTPVGKSTANAGGTKTPTRPQASGTLTGSGARAANGAVANKSATRAALAETQEEAFKTKRDERREQRLASINQVRATRAAALRKKKQQAKIRQYGTIAAIVIAFLLIFGLIALLIHNLSAPAHAQITGQYGRNIACESMEEAAVHYHANLQIIINGKSEPVPAGVGFSPNPAMATCLYWLHTHDNSGVIHIEAPQGSATRQFLLGDFFAIWAQDPANSIAFGAPELTATNFFGHPIDKNHPLTVYVDGKLYTGDPNQIVLKPHENIWLEYGTPLVPPTPYTFPAGE